MQQIYLQVASGTNLLTDIVKRKGREEKREDLYDSGVEREDNQEVGREGDIGRIKRQMACVDRMVN